MNELDNICKISQISRPLYGQQSKNVLAFLSSRMMETVTKEVRKITISAQRSSVSRSTTRILLLSTNVIVRQLQLLIQLTVFLTS